MRIIDDIKLDFCDVLIQPKRSETASRSHVDISRKYVFKTSQREWEGVPIIAANMSAVGTFNMADALSKENMSTCLHKHYSIEKLIEFFTSKNSDNVYYTMGISDEDMQKCINVYKVVSLKNICIDVANGYSKFFVDRVRYVRDIFPKAIIMAGNVASSEMVSELLISGGADIVKIGVGSGSVCTTRITAGVGYPQFSAIIECADTAHGLGGHICSDGGCTTPGDVVKAFAAGSDFVMLGGMLAGHDECEGEWEEDTMYIPGPADTVVKNKKAFKFFGMSSKEAADKFNGGLKDYRAAEGKCVTVPYRGPVKNTLQQITGGIRSACAYTGATKLKYLSRCTTFIKVNRTHNQVFGD